jgi:hypothetical protein
MSTSCQWLAWLLMAERNFCGDLSLLTFQFVSQKISSILIPLYNASIQTDLNLFASMP